MAVPYRLLMDGEEIVAHRHPHARVLLRPAVATVVTVGLAGLLIAVVSQPRTRWGIAAAAVVVLLASVSRPVLHWLTTTLTVTDRRLLLRSGIVARYGRDIPLGRIDEVSFEQTLVERALGSGTLYVELAAERGVVVVQNVPRVATVQAAIDERLEGYEAEEAAGVDADEQLDGSADEDRDDQDGDDEGWDTDGEPVDAERSSARSWLRRRRPAVS